MAAPRRKRKVKMVMGGRLKSGARRRVKNRNQAFAIGMSESGPSRKRRGGKSTSPKVGKKAVARRKSRMAKKRST
jgi:hypothetical protein